MDAGEAEIRGCEELPYMARWSLYVTVPRRCCSFSIPTEGPENLHWPLGDLSRQATQGDGRGARAGRQLLALHRAELCHHISGARAPGGAPSVLTHRFLGVCRKSLAPALQLRTSPLPGGPGACVICCFFKLAPHPWTVCQEGPLFMRIPR